MNNLTLIINLSIVRQLIEKKQYEKAIGMIMGLSASLLGDFPK